MADINIEAKLYASLRRLKDEPTFRRSLREPCLVLDFLRKEGIPDKDVAIIMLNGDRAKLDSPLSDGDVLSLFPSIGGG